MNRESITTIYKKLDNMEGKEKNAREFFRSLANEVQESLENAGQIIKTDIWYN